MILINVDNSGTILLELLMAVVNKQTNKIPQITDNKTIFLPASIKFILFNKLIYRQIGVYEMLIAALFADVKHS